ncbi:unnamed protein product [Cyprideis torosa]|uniref:Uncharacterized protein n=1 Tax=Cyprideis torosa TaxID=163714 RepID=A0A7R8WRA5_9CRUS|nr:unnamed protein product [Cyprideis torosa]CAG0903963.1 unnamed protein product [Cyprideis torosa]
MGYRLKRFQEVPPPEFVCGICNFVLCNPKEVSCPEKHLFCLSCITDYGAQKEPNRCPACFQPFREIKEPASYFVTQYNRLLLDCAFSDLGCRETTNINSIEWHEEHCAYNPETVVRCTKGPGCWVKRCDLETHDCVTQLVEELQELRTEVEELRTTNQHQGMEIQGLKSAVRSLQKAIQSQAAAAGEPEPPSRDLSPVSVRSNADSSAGRGKKRGGGAKRGGRGGAQGGGGGSAFPMPPPMTQPPPPPSQMPVVSYAQALRRGQMLKGTVMAHYYHRGFPFVPNQLADAFRKKIFAQSSSTDPQHRNAINQMASDLITTLYQTGPRPQQYDGVGASSARLSLLIKASLLVSQSYNVRWLPGGGPKYQTVLIFAFENQEQSKSPVTNIPFPGFILINKNCDDPVIRPALAQIQGAQ